MLMWHVGLRIGNARPCACGWKRRMYVPCGRARGGAGRRRLTRALSRAWLHVRGGVGQRRCEWRTGSRGARKQGVYQAVRTWSAMISDTNSLDFFMPFCFALAAHDSIRS